MMGNLPNGWSIEAIGDFMIEVKEKVDPTESTATNYIGLEHIESNGRLIGKGNSRDVKSTKTVFKANDVLYGKLRPYLNKHIMVDFDGVCSTDILVYRNSHLTAAKYFNYWLDLDTTIKQINAEAKGINLPRVSSSILNSFKIPVPPENELKRIVAKLDRLFAHHDQLKDRLEKIPGLIKHFRQVVLIHAITGKLTEEWRGTANYREIWIEDPLKQRILGLKDWQLLKFNEACKLIGGSQPPKSTFVKAKQEGYVRLIQIRDYKSDDYIVYIPKSEARRFCTKDDIMIGRYGPPIFQILRGLEGAYNVALMKAEPIDYAVLDKEYLYYYLQNHLLFQYVDSGSHRTAGQTGVNKEYLESYPFFLPPLEEQKEIVRRIQSLFALADRIEASYKNLQEKIIQLPQAILSKAFQGKLVDQNPNDGSAQDFLDKIGEERLRNITQEKVKPAKVSKSKIHIIKGPVRDKPIRKSIATEDIMLSMQNSFLGTESKYFKIRRLQLINAYNSLRPFDQLFSWPTDQTSIIDPICLVGPNGSGKSNLLELLAEIFYHAEISSRYKLSKRDTCPVQFELDYFIKNGSKIRKIRLANHTKTLQCFELNDSEVTEIVNEDIQDVLPSIIVGYSSGMNESLSFNFRKSSDLYQKKVFEYTSSRSTKYLDNPRMIFFDYEMNNSVLIANYLLGRRHELDVFKEKLNVNRVHSFDIHINLIQRRGNKQILLTRELENNIDRLAKLASRKNINKKLGVYQFHYELNPTLKKNFKEEFATAYDLYMTFFKFDNLNALNLAAKYRKTKKLDQFITSRPTLADQDKVFRISDISVAIQTGKTETVIPYIRISDGEHQYLHVMGLAMLMNKPNVLFLLDEPETHFDPDWRSEFIDNLNSIVQGGGQEYLLSTHSPFVVSDCNGYNVFTFTRNEKEVSFANIGIETYGTSFDALLTKAFGFTHTISQKAYNEIQTLLKSTSKKKIEKRIQDFGPSYEKLALLKKVKDMN